MTKKFPFLYSLCRINVQFLQIYFNFATIIYDKNKPKVLSYEKYY